jgi:hypothetical protein
VRLPQQASVSIQKHHSQGDVEVDELKEKANQPGVEVWFVGGTVVVDDWADTIVRRGQGGQM